jgi:hypothetical protein
MPRGPAHLLQHLHLLCTRTGSTERRPAWGAVAHCTGVRTPRRLLHARTARAGGPLTPDPFYADPRLTREHCFDRLAPLAGPRRAYGVIRAHSACSCVAQQPRQDRFTQGFQESQCPRPACAAAWMCMQGLLSHMGGEAAALGCAGSVSPCSCGSDRGVKLAGDCKDLRRRISAARVAGKRQAGGQCEGHKDAHPPHP